MSRELLLQAVSDAYKAGICVLPPRQDGTKAPLAEWYEPMQKYTWEPFLSARSTPREHNRWYGDTSRTGIGWVCGEVSGNLEVIDFDTSDSYAAYAAAAKYSGVAEILVRVEAGYKERTPHGVHIAYRCSVISGALKLAQRKVGKGVTTLIETKGEGGFVIVAPTHGAVNASGNYVLESGSPCDIVTITPEEREQLHDLARLLDEMPISAPAQRAGKGAAGNRPGDIYQRKAAWSDVLVPAGWTEVGHRGEVTDWRRPGKTCGISATTNYHGSDCLWVFSSNGAPFEPGKSYTKFGAYAILHHFGDWTAATRAVAMMYPDEIDDADGIVDISAIMPDVAQPEPERKKLDSLDKVLNDIYRAKTLPEELFDVPGLVGDLASWINDTSHRRQPVLALGASIAAVSTAIGRKVQTSTGMRSNVYILGVANTGDGKERARQAIREVFDGANAPHLVGYDKFASDAAIISAVMRTPACLFMVDEFGKFFRSVSRSQNSWQANICDELLRLYNTSGRYYRKVVADAFKDDDSLDFVWDPCLSIYGTTTPSALYASLSSEQVHDGFLSRFLIFEGEHDVPELRYPLVAEAPRPLVEGIKRWTEYKSDRNTEGEDLHIECPKLDIVETDDDAEALLRMFDEKSDTFRRKLRKSKRNEGIFARCGTFARKLALIRACGTCHAPGSAIIRIRIADALWALKLAWYSVCSMYSRVEEHVSDNVYEANYKRIESSIREAGPSGVTSSVLSRRLRSIKAQERHAHLREMMDEGSIALVRSTVGKKTVDLYIWTK